MTAQTGAAPVGIEQSVADTLSRPFAITYFKDFAARTKQEGSTTLPALAQQIRQTSRASKAQLPWLKLASFGTKLSDKKSLRHDANVLAISGVEADYDGENVPFGHAVEILSKAGILALVYTSPSHTEDTPRWRILCPTSGELPPDRRDGLMGRLNGLFGGIFSAESWTLSQGYYFGSVASNPSHQVELVDGAPIDLHDDLDVIWRGKSGLSAPATGAPVLKNGRVDEAQLRREITSGEAFHTSSVRLLGRWARDGIACQQARARLTAMFDEVPEERRDARWQERRGDIDRCLEDIYGKEAAQRDAGRRPVSNRGQGVPTAEEGAWLPPVDFLADGEMTGVPELRPEHLPDTLYPFVTDTAARMGVDPVAVALSALVSCASVVHEDWRIQPKRHDDTWTEAARIWGAIVGDPSILKTPVIAACTRPIERLELAARDQHAAAAQRHKAQMAAWKEAGSDPAAKPVPPRLDRYLVEGTTIEALSEVLRDDEEARHRVPTGRVLVRQDEMSEWIAGFDRYRSGGRGGGDRGAYLRLYNGGSYVVDRVGRGSFAVPNWSACVLGGIQPEPIQRIARDAADDGLLQRFLYCVPARQGMGQDRQPDRAAIARYEALIASLVALQPQQVQDTGPAARRRALVLAEAAHRHREEMEGLVRAMAALPGTSSRLKV
ncbi:DUF3987 domain-containing protein [Dankookia rubra]|uniref:DUF3987 domain-containing protein n=1 Tax=Dankookia rubra TaxID=1442381 RepID=A0A4V3AA35_9PROT|nr:DUF3987 domain-containing protein [Dankookia rubra]TDH61575.1 DUF3987 domain-containing protein [Dankookia rubra]